MLTFLSTALAFCLSEAVQRVALCGGSSLTPQHAPSSSARVLSSRSDLLCLRCNPCSHISFCPFRLLPLEGVFVGVEMRLANGSFAKGGWVPMVVEMRGAAARPRDGPDGPDGACLCWFCCPLLSSASLKKQGPRKQASSFSCPSKTSPKSVRPKGTRPSIHRGIYKVSNSHSASNHPSWVSKHHLSTAAPVVLLALF